MLLLWWCPFKTQKEKRAGLQFTSTDYLSLLLTPLRICWTIPLIISHILTNLRFRWLVYQPTLSFTVDRFRKIPSKICFFLISVVHCPMCIHMAQQKLPTCSITIVYLYYMYIYYPLLMYTIPYIHILSFTFNILYTVYTVHIILY
jgi:hypothetical protein